MTPSRSNRRNTRVDFHHRTSSLCMQIARSFGTKVAQKSFEIYHVDEACAPPEQSVLESFSHYALRVFCFHAVCRLIWCGLVVSNRFVTLGSFCKAASMQRPAFSEGTRGRKDARKKEEQRVRKESRHADAEKNWKRAHAGGRLKNEIEKGHEEDQPVSRPSLRATRRQRACQSPKTMTRPNCHPPSP